MNKQVIPQYKIAQFNSRHDVTENQQFKALVEEVGELAETLNTEKGDDAVAEELADVIFVARSLAELRDINITSELVETIAENSEKDESVDGNKVTKQTQ
jgi:NTP pyrophosphatase (non-canonical NTP hydrolase)